MDLFYYGSQDVPLPLWRGERPPLRSRPGGGAAHCESCNRVVPAEDLREGRAAEVYGLVLCGSCREKAPAEERVELYFCDRCQVSVPVYRIETGEALLGDGRILCLACRERATLSARRRVAVPAVLALVALAGLAGYAVRGPVVEPALPDAVALVGEVLGSPALEVGSAERLEDLKTRLAGLGLELDRLREARERVLGTLEEANAAILLLRGEVERRLDLLEAESRDLLAEVERALGEAEIRR